MREDGNGRDQRAVDQTVSEWLSNYTPSAVDAATWRSIRGFVLNAIGLSEPYSLSSAKRYVRELTRLACWARGEGLPLDREVLLDPAMVERFVEVGLRGEASAGTYRSDLRALGPRLTKAAPWQPRPPAITHRKVAAPYTRGEASIVWADAKRQGTAAKRTAAMAMVALGLGAGLDGRWNVRVRPQDVLRIGGGLGVRVGEPCPRVVPVRADWEVELEEAVARVGPSEYLTGGTSQDRNRASNLISRFESGHGNPRLAANRLRSTWLVRHLTLGTRLPELAAAAGMEGVTVLSDLLPFVELLPPAQAQTLLRGRR